jgi:predicted N-acetyltransferase YhbS
VRQGEFNKKIEVLTFGDDLWSRGIEYAETCSWGAGRVLAGKMRENDFEANERVIAALHDGNIAAFCTFSNRDELPPEYNFSPFVGFVFVDEKFRGRRLSGNLIEAACGLAREQGFTAIYLMSGEVGLYEKYGFRKIGDYGTIYGSVEQLFAREL